MGKKQARGGSILPLPAATAYPTTTGTLAPLEEWLLLLGNIAVNIATILCRVRVQKGRERAAAADESETRVQLALQNVFEREREGTS